MYKNSKNIYFKIINLLKKRKNMKLWAVEPKQCRVVSECRAVYLFFMFVTRGISHNTYSFDTLM